MKPIFFFIAGVVVCAAVAGVAWEHVAQRGTLRDFPPPGAMVDAGGARIQLDCRGSGAPTVVFETGLNMSGSLDWTQVHPEVARHTRACVYSRAGMMWSEPAREPQSAEAIAKTLHTALQRAGERGPIVLVGHSMGGPYAMTFTRLFGADVAGLVLVDAAHPDQNRRFASMIHEQLPLALRVAAALRQFGVARALSPHLAPDMGGRTDAQTEAIRGYVSRSVETLVQENDAIDQTLAQAGELRQLGDRPLVVLTATRPYDEAELRSMHVTAEPGKAVLALWIELQADMARWSRRGEQRLVPGAGHSIQFDAPSEVIDATLRVVDLVREETPTPPASP